MFLTKCLSKCPSFTTSLHPSLPWKISGCAPTLRHYCFCKTLDLKCLTVFWMPCLNNCLIIYPVTLFSVLNQTHSEFWHIQLSVFSGICRHFQTIFNVIACTKKYLQSDCLRGIQYWPYLYFVFNICTLWLNKKKNTTFEFRSGKIEMYSLKTN